MTSQYNRYSSRRPGKKREIHATEEMKKLVPTSRICINTEGDTIYVYNGQAKPITATLGDPLATIKVLQPKVMILFKKTEAIVIEWCNLLSDELLRLEQEPSLEDEDEEDRKSHPIHKYSKDVSLLEAVTIGGQPFFIQMKKGPNIDINTLSEYAVGDIVLKPRGIDNYLCEPIIFKSKDEVIHYLKAANKISANMNFDKMFRLVKTIFRKYVVLDDHYITLLVADTIYTYFQDKFATTHYDMCVGDNSSGKNSILLTVEALGYHVVMGTSISGPNLITALGSKEYGQITLAEDEIDKMDEDPDKKNIWKSGYAMRGCRIPKHTDMNGGRTQEWFYSFCFKICASEKSLDDLKSRGLLDRTFVIQCLVGKPDYNIKKVYEETAASQYLRNEIEKTRKLLFACRMLYHGDIIPNIGLNIINREAELTEFLIRLFQNSSETLKELLPALTKCLGIKREMKSTSIESVLYTVMCNLTNKDVEAIENFENRKDDIHLNTKKEETSDNFTKRKEIVKGNLLMKGVNGWTIDYQPIMWELERLTCAKEIVEKEEEKLQCDLGRFGTAEIIKILVDKFKAERTHTGSGINKRKAIFLTEKNLERKKIDFDVPSKIEIRPYVNKLSGPDDFDLTLLDDGINQDWNGVNSEDGGTHETDLGGENDPEGSSSSGNVDPKSNNTEDDGTHGTHLDGGGNGKNERSGTHGTRGTLPGGMDCKNQQHQDPRPDLKSTESQEKSPSDGVDDLTYPDKTTTSEQGGTKTIEQKDTPYPKSASQASHGSHGAQKMGRSPEDASHESQSETKDIDHPPQPDPKTEEELKPLDLSMPEELEDHLGVVTEEELQHLQEQSSSRTITQSPIMSVEQFFNNDISLLNHHSIEQSPCYPIIGSRTDQQEGNVVDNDGNVVEKVGYPNTVYYCKLHPDLGSVYLEEIEFHCRQKESDIHRAEILRLELQKQRGESA